LLATSVWSCLEATLVECLTPCTSECPVGLECREGYCMLPGSERVCSEPPACVALDPVELPDRVCSDEPFEFPVHARGGKPPYSWTIAPRRITIIGDEAGADISVGGEFPRVDPERPPFTVRVVGSEGGDCGAAELMYQLPLFERPSWDGVALPPACAGRPYVLPLTVTGGDAATYQFRRVALPGWLSLSAEGVLAGTPEAAGTFRVEVEVSDAHCASLPASQSLSVLAPPACVTLHPDTLAAPCVGVPYLAQLSADGGQPRDVEPRYDWTALSKPSWLDFEPDTQVLSALAANLTEAAAAEDGRITVRVSDALGQIDTRTFDLTPRSDCGL
jgi:hypothetical protein